MEKKKKKRFADDKGTSFPREGAQLQHSPLASRWLRPWMVELCEGFFILFLLKNKPADSERGCYGADSWSENRSAEYNSKLQRQKKINI